jgi:hypothetical protein
MSEEQNKALIRRYFEEIDAEARDKRGVSVLDEFLPQTLLTALPLLAFHLTWKV